MSTELEQLREEQHATLELLQAMYPLESELVLSSEAQLLLVSSSTSDLPEWIHFDLNLALYEGELSDVTQTIGLTIVLAFKSGLEKTIVNLRSSPFSRSQHEELRACIQPIEPDQMSSDHILEQIERVRQNAIDMVYNSSTAVGSSPDEAADISAIGRQTNLERVWFWFPSLSSREKRKDLVVFAHDAGLTGFVLAGKPGLLCVEGDGKEVDEYMARIKSESWSDIPSYQKKVTERLRLPLESTKDRLLPRMTDITDQISHYGQYAHRAEMGEVRKQMVAWGVEEEWSKVIMGSGS